MKATVIFQMVIVISIIAGNVGQAQQDTITLENGRVLMGTVEKTTENSVTFKYKSGEEGENTVTFHADELDPYSFYAVRLEGLGRDGAAHLELAKWCAHNGMYARVLALYNRAKMLDPGVVEAFDKNEKVEFKEDLADKLLAQAKKARDRGDRAAAVAHLDVILIYLHETKASVEAQALVQEVAVEQAEEPTKYEVEELNDASAVKLLLKDGTNLICVVESSTEDSLRLQVMRQGIRAGMTVPAARIDPHAFYKYRNLTMEDDAEQRLTLIKFCIENGMFTRALFQYELAKAQNPAYMEKFEQEDLPAVRQRIAEDRLAAASEALNAGDFDEAGRDLSYVLTRFDDTPVGDKAKAMLDTLEDAILTQDEKERTETVAQLKSEQKEDELKAYEAQMKLLAPATKAMEEGRRANTRALKDSRNNQAVGQFKLAAKHFERAVKHLDDLAKKHKEDTGLQPMIAKERAEAVDDAVDAYLNAGKVLMQRTSFKQAYAVVDEALKVDPGNHSAQSFMAEVEAAERLNASSDRRGFGRRR